MQLFDKKLQWYHIDALAKMKMSLSTLWCVERWIAGDKVETKETKKLRDTMWIKDDTLQQIAQDVYYGLLNMEEPKKGKIKAPVVNTQYDQQWEQWWLLYPSNAQFEYKGHLFKSERVLKSNKQVCKTLYIKIVQGGVKPEVLKKCLEVEIATRKEESHTSWKKENKLQYMSGCEVWLRQGKYEGYINREMEKEDEYINYGG